MIYDRFTIPTLGFYDLILIAFVEIFFIWFFFPEERMGIVLQMVGAANLIKVGAMSLVYSILPSLEIGTISHMLLIEVAIIFIIGIVTSTLIYEREKWSPTREQAGDLAFRITAISSVVWVTFKSIQPTLYIDPFIRYDPEFVFMSGAVRDQSHLITGVISSGLPIESFGFFILIIGLGILYFKYKKKDGLDLPRG